MLLFQPMTDSTALSRLPLPPERKHELMVAALKGLGNGTSLMQTCRDHGVPFETLRGWLLRAVPDEYRELQEIGLIQRILDCDQELDDAATLIDVQRADKKAKYARWDAERRLPHLFSQKQEIKHSGEVKTVFDVGETARRLAFVMASADRKLGGGLIIDAEIVEPGPVDDLF